MISKDLESGNRIDPYLNALHIYHGENMREYENIKELLERLDPRKDEEKWSLKLSRKAFYDPNKHLQ